MITMEFIDYMNIGTGLLLIVVGWLCYRNPNLINPYGGMSLERKALVDIDGLKRALAIILTVAGGLMIVAAVLGALDVIDELTSVWALTTIALVMIIPMFIAMKRYNGFGRDELGKIPWRNEMASKAASKATWVILGLSMVFVALIFAMSSRLEIKIGEESVKITGMYGRDVPVSEIVSVALLEKLPPMQRTNGSNVGKYMKGHFQLKNGEKCMVYICIEPPYIELRTSNDLYYFNTSKKEETIELFEELKNKLP